MWASTQYNLAYACSEANNLETAIISCTEALKIWTFNKFPKQWANTQKLLGDAYRNQTKGDKAENLERAIKAFENALIVNTREKSPKVWGNISITAGSRPEEK
jgi:tetratricopeptide (TPR) repeat protein